MSRSWLSDDQIRKQKFGNCSRTSLYRYRREDARFPRPRRYAGRNLTPEDEIDSYLELYFDLEQEQPLPATPAPRNGEPPAPRDRLGRFGNDAAARKPKGVGAGP